MQTLCLLLVVSLFLLSLGPMLDHHYAERHPEHNHIYLGAVISDHSHSFESNHEHDNSRMLRTLLQHPDNLPSDGVVVVPPNSGNGMGATDLAIPMSLQNARMYGDDGQGIPRLYADAYDMLVSTSITPPRPPPRL